jgi:hypothetical protein
MEKPSRKARIRLFASQKAPLNPGGQYRFEVNFENLPRMELPVPMTQVVKIAY